MSISLWARPWAATRAKDQSTPPRPRSSRSCDSRTCLPEAKDQLCGLQQPRLLPKFCGPVLGILWHQNTSQNILEKFYLWIFVTLKYICEKVHLWTSMSVKFIDLINFVTCFFHRNLISKLVALFSSSTLAFVHPVAMCFLTLSSRDHFSLSIMLLWQFSALLWSFT